MASAYRDKNGWTAQFRPLHAPPGTRRKIRLPRNTPDPHAHAEECERACRYLEKTTYPARADIQHALKLRAITTQQAATLDANHAPPHDNSSHLSLEQLALAHPSTNAEQHSNRPRDYDRHLAELRQFIQHTGIHTVRHLRLQHVTAYIQHLANQQLAPDTIRHRLLWLRRATHMGTHHGYPDILAGLRINTCGHRQPTPPPTLTLHQLATIIAFNLHTPHRAIPGPIRPVIANPTPHNRHRLLATVALGALTGLRPSEIARLQKRDITHAEPDTLILHIGTRARKTALSRRDLPLPPIAVPWLTPLLRDPRPPHAPVVGAQTTDALNRWTAPRLAAPLMPHPDPASITAGTGILRRTFATIAHTHGLTPDQYEPYLGHRSALALPITARHYLGTIALQKLIPTAHQISQIITDAIRGLGHTAGHNTSHTTENTPFPADC